jgi:hypothetical protein
MTKPQKCSDLEMVLICCRELCKISLQPPTAIELASRCGMKLERVVDIISKNKEEFRESVVGVSVRYEPATYV